MVPLRPQILRRSEGEEVMTIKAGDWVAFQVGITAIHNYRAGLSAGWMHESELIKILPPDPHAGLKEAVVDSACKHIAAAKNRGTARSDHGPSWQPLWTDVEALEAAQAPPSKKHLCTPLQAAAPDMLALLQDIDRSTYLPRETGLQERLEAVVAKAKGTPDA